MYDYLIKDATIVDGTGKKAYKGNVAIYKKDIAFISCTEKPKSKCVIDGTGLYLTPGFIDLHAHSEFYMLNKPQMKGKLGQGITTDCSGNCGIGVFPLNDGQEALKALSSEVLGTYPSWSWTTITEFKDKVREKGVGINVTFLQAHAPLRVAVMKEECNRAATKEEIDEMCALLDESLNEGAVGFSSGLYYAPCLFATDEEMIALLKVVKAHQAFFAVHHKCEGDDVVESVENVINYARVTGVRLEISHLKAIGVRNQDKVDKVLELIDCAVGEGLDVKFDQYPYSFGSTSLFSLLPPRIQKLSRIEQRFALSIDAEIERMEEEMENPVGWDSIYSLCGSKNIKITELSNNKEYEGLNLDELGEKLKLTPLRALLYVLSEESGSAIMFDETETEENLIKILKHPLMSFGTDSLYSSEHPHPRSFSSAVELIKKYVLDKKVISVEEAVNKMTYRNAQQLGLKDRGLIEEGKIADLVLFDPKTLNVSYTDEVKSGIKAVFVNGNLAVFDNAYTDKLYGEVL